MIIRLNGEPQETQATTLAALLAEIELDQSMLATALNGDFVPCDDRATTNLQEGDRIEVLAPMQGG